MKCNFSANKVNITSIFSICIKKKSAFARLPFQILKINLIPDSGNPKSESGGIST
jgi:hypothetical protein